MAWEKIEELKKEKECKTIRNRKCWGAKLTLSSRDVLKVLAVEGKGTIEP